MSMRWKPKLQETRYFAWLTMVIITAGWFSAGSAEAIEKTEFAMEILVDGAAELRVVEEFFATDLPGKPTDTVSLWVLNHTACIPQENETYLIDGLEVTIIKATSRKIHRVTIQRTAGNPESGAEAGSE